MLWVWISAAGTILVAVILAGRAHSRALDRAEARAQLSIMQLSIAGLPDLGSEVIENSVTGTVPLAVFMGEQVLVYAAPADQANEILKPRDGRSAAEVLNLPSAFNSIGKPMVRDAFWLKPSRKAS